MVTVDRQQRRPAQTGRAVKVGILCAVGAGVGALLWGAVRWWRANKVIREERNKFKGFWPDLVGTVTREKADFRFCRWRERPLGGESAEHCFPTAGDVEANPRDVRECWESDRQRGLLFDTSGDQISDPVELLRAIVEEKRELVHSQKRLYRFCQESLLSGLLTLDMGDPLPGEEDAVSMERNFTAMLEPPRWKLFKRNAFRTLKSLSAMHSRLRAIQLVLGEEYMEWKKGATPANFESPVWEAPSPGQPHRFSRSLPRPEPQLPSSSAFARPSAPPL